MMFARTTEKAVLQHQLNTDSARGCEPAESLNVESLDGECRRPRALFPRTESSTGLKFGRLVPREAD